MQKFLLKIFSNLSRRTKVIILIFVDFFALLFFWLVFNKFVPGAQLQILYSSTLELKHINLGEFRFFLISYVVLVFYFLISGFYRNTIKSFESSKTLIRVTIGSFIYSFVYSLNLYIYDDLPDKYFVYISLFFLIFMIAFAIIKITRDYAYYFLYEPTRNTFHKNVLIYGSGEAGKQLYNTIKNDININIIGFFDDNKIHSGSEIGGIRVYSKTKHLKFLKNKYPDLGVYLAIPSIDSITRNNIISKLEDLKFSVRTIPGLRELIHDEEKLADIQDLSLEDVLLRDSSSNFDFDFSNRSILVTGAGGSIGSELCRQLLQSNPKKLILYEISEFNLYSIKQELTNLALKNNIKSNIHEILGDIKNTNRISEIIKKYDVDCIYHAAAYKHVPIVENIDNIFEAVNNNIFGTFSILDASIKTNVKDVVVISTDKAVRPTNIMGASKRVSELVAQAMNASQIKTKISMVRFGNVMNSSGSVIPLFKSQIRSGGPVTLTHKDVTRFFMTIPEASNLVIQAGQYAEGGEVFLLNMGEQVKIYDLAKRLIHLSGRNIASNAEEDGIEIKEIGLRPGEKLFEELLINGDETYTPNPRIFKSNEEFIEINNLLPWLKEIKNATQIKDESILKEIFSKIVEGYNPNSPK